MAEGGGRIEASSPACDLFEGSLECLECGACCGAAFDTVEVAPRDPFRTKHPDLVAKRDGRWQIHRTADNRCVCLQPDLKCVHYGDRPRCCRDFERGSLNCVFARRRIGLSASWAGPPVG